MAIAYAVAISRLTKDAPTEEDDIDISRLDWGTQFKEYAYSTSPSTHITDISLDQCVRVKTAGGAAGSIILPNDVDLKDLKKGFMK